ncbi:hypothetical protein CA85_46270 [Allorhodopirellula solitaria]|uniref:Uncharacterized protein n=1 Tax=Allorhodopirellula solitaria TaxID=2527987 RepID=A0A5C5X1K5_9BACT|nr:hypothetical protein CA85_46270 [Allorhodopirellula solitaria]
MGALQLVVSSATEKISQNSPLIDHAMLTGNRQEATVSWETGPWKTGLVASLTRRVTRTARSLKEAGFAAELRTTANPTA